MLLNQNRLSPARDLSGVFFPIMTKNALHLPNLIKALNPERTLLLVVGINGNFDLALGLLYVNVKTTVTQLFYSGFNRLFDCGS